jgi:hypothetical protein
MPAYLYRRLRTPDRKDPHPVVVTKKFVTTSSKQASDYLLCSDCEDLFNKNGEAWMSLNGFEGPGKFKLQELLKAAIPLAEIRNAKLISGKGILRAETEKLAYFPTSVFWRAAVHSWKLERHRLKKINLGKYEDDFRRYLLAKRVSRRTLLCGAMLRQPKYRSVAL